jgi:hypothetical protein
MAALVIALVCAPATRAPAAGNASAPFAVAASIGPNASSRVDATVTRMVNGAAVTLPAAIVPALAPGDVVDVRFPDYTRPPARANYHVNVAFITEVPPLHWLYERSGPEDRLFSNDRRKKPTAPAHLHFVYGTPDHRGIPIFFIVPEDAKTRGMDGARNYVQAHPTDFKNMSESANDAVTRYSWFRDFLQSLAQGAIDPVSGQQRVEDIAASLGAPPGAVSGCYATGGSQSDVANCIQTTLLSVQYQTNIDAPTTAQFFGGVAGAASPAQMAFYIQPLLAMWQIFARIGHQEYEYLPATLQITAPPAGARFGTELLMGAKVPTLRPPGARSSVLFFTIGDAEAAQNPPQVTGDAPAAGLCARTDRIALPIHLDRTSPFVTDGGVVVTPEHGSAFTLPLDPRTLATPVIERSQLERAGFRAQVALTGHVGFAPLARERIASVQIALPHPAPWFVAPAPHRAPIAGGTLDVIATSSQAPCLSSAELQIGDAAPVPLTLTRLDDRRIELRASLQSTPPGNAEIRFSQDDPLHRTRIEDAVALGIAHPPARVANGAAPSAAIGDAFVSIAGTGLETTTGLRLGGATYAKDPASTSTAACYSGPPIAGRGLEPGQSLTAQLFGASNAPGQVFTLTLTGPRPVLAQSAVVPNAPSHLSTDTLRVVLQSGPRGLPAHREVRIRRARSASTPCDAVRDATTYATVPDAATHEATGSELDLTLRAGETLGDRAFGTVQVQLVDADTKLTSAWENLPGSFVRAPTVSRIDCPATPAAPCTLLGTNLSAIDGVQDANGQFVAPDPGCTTNAKGLTCVRIPHVGHVTLRLGDAQTVLPLPDALLDQPPLPAPSPSRSPSPAS